jgi:hypothetical protein
MDIAPYRLNLLRAGYGLLIVGLGLVIWPSILNPAETWEPDRGVIVAMLGALSLLALIGLRHPLRMLPILFWEMTWKAIWLLRVALPQSLGGGMDEATTQTAIECALAVLIAAVVPWDHVWRTYVIGAGDRWRRS